MMRTILLALTFLLCAPVGGEAVTVAPFGTVERPDQKTLPPKLAEAIAALLKGQHDRALTVAREFVRAEPRSVVGQQILGAAALAMRQWKEVERALTQAARLEPRRPSAWIGLGQVTLAPGDARKAETLFRKAVELEPKMGAARAAPSPWPSSARGRSSRPGRSAGEPPALGGTGP